MVVESLTYLVNLINNDTLMNQINRVRQIIDKNKTNQSIHILQDYYDSLLQAKNLNSERVNQLLNRAELIEFADSLGSSSTDSLFTDVTEALMLDDSTRIADSIWLSKALKTDSLIGNLSQIINRFNQNNVIMWIDSIRRDTFEFYLIGIEGDSLKISLYNNNPQIIRFNIDDYWGSKVKAMIRDIQSNSMKILIDDAPLIDSKTRGKAIQAMGSMNRERHKKKLTIKTIEIPPNNKFWILGGNASFDLSQIGQKNWVKGGEPSVSFLSGLELFANFKKDNKSWDNNGKFRFGMLSQGQNIDLRPNEDRIELTTKYGHKLFGQYYLSALGDFKSQFANAYTYPTDTTQTLVSQFFSPAYLTIAAGLDYNPDNNTTFFLSPLTSKSTFVLNDSIDETSYGLEPGKKIRSETGAIFKVTYKRKVWGNIEVQNYLELFSSYLDKPQNVDVNWELKILLPVNDFIRATLSTNLIYDDNVSIPVKDSNPARTTKALQLKELIAVGFAMKF